MATNRKPKGPQETAVFIDGNWLLHRVGYTKGANSSRPSKVVPLAILDYCCVYALEKRAAFGSLTFDGANNFRYKVYPNYKSNRGGVRGAEEIDDDDGNIKDAIYECLAPTAELFNLVNFPVVQLDEFEADDLISSGANAFVGETKLKDRMAWIVCRDKDSLQSVRDNINVYWPKVGTNPAQDWDEAAVKKHRGFSPQGFGDYQILVGDETDSVPSIVKPKQAKEILKKHLSLRLFFQTKEGSEFFTQHSAELVRNLKLVRMDNSSWRPSSHEIRLSRLEATSAAISRFGKLPQSFYALRSTLGGSSRSLFG